MAQIAGNEALVLNGDSIFKMDIYRFYQFYLEKKANILLALKKIGEASRYGSVKIDNHNRVIAFEEKSKYSENTLINAGHYIINKSFYLQFTDKRKFSIEKDVFEKMVESESIYGFVSDGYFIDIGTPKDYLKAKHEFENL